MNSFSLRNRVLFAHSWLWLWGSSTRAPPTAESSVPVKYGKNVVRYFEIDIRHLMSTTSGQFFEEKVIAFPLENRFGDDDWWFNLEYAQAMIKHLKMNTACEWRLKIRVMIC